MKALLNLPDAPRAQKAFVHSCKIVVNEDGTPGVAFSMGTISVGVAYMIKEEHQLEVVKSHYPESRYRFSIAPMTLQDSRTLSHAIVFTWW